MTRSWFQWTGAVPAVSVVQLAPPPVQGAGPNRDVVACDDRRCDAPWVEPNPGYRE